MHEIHTACQGLSPAGAQFYMELLAGAFRMKTGLLFICEMQKGR